MSSFTNDRVRCGVCGAHGETVHIMCHGYWDEVSQRMEVIHEVDGIDWYCDQCDGEVSVETVSLDELGEK